MPAKVASWTVYNRGCGLDRPQSKLCLQLQKIPSTTLASHLCSIHHTHRAELKIVYRWLVRVALPPSQYHLCHQPIVPPAALETKFLSALCVQSSVRPSNLLAAASATEDEYPWLSKVKTAVEESTIDGWISYSLPTMLTHRALSSHRNQGTAASVS